MGVRKKRIVATVFVCLGAIVTSAAGALGAAVGDQERVTQGWSRAVIGDGGNALVTEVIDYDFGFGTTHHGIYRDVDDLPVSTKVDVASPSAPDGVVKLPYSGGTTLRIGDPARTVSGRHRYRIDYGLSTLVRGNRVEWDTFGSRWEFPFERVEIHLLSSRALESPTCNVGRQGAVGGCTAQQVEPGHLEVVIDHLDAEEGVRIDAVQGALLPVRPAVPNPPIGTPVDEGSGVVKPGLFALLGALIGALPAMFVVRRAGREEIGAGGAADAAFADVTTAAARRIDAAELDKLTTIEFSPPPGMTPSQGGVVLAEAVQSEHKVAWLLDKSVKGNVMLDQVEGKTFRLRPTATSNDGDAEPLQWMFDGRPEVTLGKYDPSFKKGFDKVADQLTLWRRASGYWEHKADTRMVGVLLLGLIGGAASVVATGFAASFGGETEGPWPVIAGLVAVAAGAFIACAANAWELRVRTPAGTAAYLQVASFRRFLHESEAEHADWAAEHGLLREYTAWAVAVGEVDHWNRAMAASSLVPQTDPGALQFAMMAPAFTSSTSHAASAPSSSGGGGGGGVGGGGGGGGGGSW